MEGGEGCNGVATGSGCRVDPAELGSALCSNLACLVSVGVRHVSLPRSLAFTLELGAATLITWLSGVVSDVSTLNVERLSSFVRSFGNRRQAAAQAVGKARQPTKANM